MFRISINGVVIERSDFNESLVDRVAFDIALTCVFLYRDKEALMEQLRYNAQEIIDRVRTTPDEAANLSAVGEDA